jgi:hypothetical protein
MQLFGRNLKKILCTPSLNAIPNPQKLPFPGQKALIKLIFPQITVIKITVTDW